MSNSPKYVHVFCYALFCFPTKEIYKVTQDIFWILGCRQLQQISFAVVNQWLCVIPLWKIIKDLQTILYLMDIHEEKPSVAENSCESGCTSPACNKLRLVNQELRDKLQKLQKAQEGSLSDSEKDELLPSLPGEEKENGNEINGIPVHQKNGSDVELTKEQVKRLKADYDDVVKKNQELENRILQMAGDLQLEKSRFEETVGSMSEQLMDFVEKMNKLERECMKNRKDCSLVVQLLKCNQSLDRKFVAQKMDQLPSDLKDKLTIELDLKQEPEPALSHHPTWSRKLWRTKSTSSAEGNTKTGSRTKAFH